MTIYNVHLYREMCLFFPHIEADTPDAAAAIASDKLTDDADSINDCNGDDLGALVDEAGDEQYERSVMIDFECERRRKAAAQMLAALQAFIEADDLAKECGEWKWENLDHAFALGRAAVNSCRGIVAETSEQGVAAELLAALIACTNYMADDLDESDETESRIFRQAYAAIVKAGAVPPLPVLAAADRPVVTISVHGGLIEDMEATIPVTVVVKDWDVPDEDTGKKPTLSAHTLAGGLSGPRLEKLRRLIAND